MSISAGLLIIAIVIIRSVALNKLPKKMFLILWGIALLRLLIPVSIPVYLDVDNVISDIAARVFPNNIGSSVTEGITYSESYETETSDPINISDVTETHKPTVQFVGEKQNLSSNQKAEPVSVPPEMIWISGMCLVLIFFITAYLRIYKELRYATLIRDNSFLNEWLEKNRLMRSVAIMQSDRIKSPLASGMVNPRIILPKSMNMEDTQLLHYALAHEYYHIKRFDAVWKLLLTSAVCIHWFNPMVWIMFILANRDLELTCDEYVILRFGAETKASYAHMLVSIADQRSRFASLYNGFSRNAIEERIESVMKIKKTSVIAVMASVILIAVMTISVAFSINASNNQNPDLSEPVSEESDDEAETADVSDISEEESYYTYEEYIEFQENQKALWLSLINCVDESWMPISGEPVLTQEMYDKVMADWDNNLLIQETLEDITNGAEIPKLPQHSYPYAVYDTLNPYMDLMCGIDNGKWILYNQDSNVIEETFDTKEAMLEKARWYLSRGAMAGDVDMAQANTVYRRLYNADMNDASLIYNPENRIVREPLSRPVPDTVKLAYEHGYRESLEYTAFADSTFSQIIESLSEDEMRLIHNVICSGLIIAVADDITGVFYDEGIVELQLADGTSVIFEIHI